MARAAIAKVQCYRTMAPGYGNSPLIDGSGSVDDLAYLYLDLAADLQLEDTVLVGACFGGWVAAEMMVRSTVRFSHLVPVDPLGIRLGGREERDIADMHALPRAEYLKLAWADPAKGDIDFSKLSESDLAAIVRGREAFTVYGWKPYMHNPRLKRWLHRIGLPTVLLWGAEDRIVTPSCGEGWRDAIPGARLEIIRNAGHFPHWEQPLLALAYNLGNFMRTLATPKTAEPWSLTSLIEKLIKIGAKVVGHGRYVTFQMAEVAVPRQMFAEILSLIAWLTGAARSG